MVVFAVLLIIGGTVAGTLALTSSDDGTADTSQLGLDESPAPETEPDPAAGAPPSEPEFTGLAQRFIDAPEVSWRFSEKCSSASNNVLDCTVIGVDWQIRLMRGEGAVTQGFYEFEMERGFVSYLSDGHCDPPYEWDVQEPWHYNDTPDKTEGSLACFAGVSGPEMLWTQEINDGRGRFFALVNVYGGDNEEVHNAFERGVILAAVD